MTEENDNTPQLSEFEASSSAQGNRKDMWLFLLIVDAVFLCIFGFFLYRNLSAHLLATPQELAATAAEPVAVEEALSLAMEEPIAMSEETVVVTAQEPAPQPKQEEIKGPAAPAPAEEKTVSTPDKASVPTDKKETKPEKPTDKKQSVIVNSNPKSKYRQVTFRYFGNAKEVAIVSGFTMAKPRALTKKRGVWEVTLGIEPGTYKYLFVVDDKQVTDPYAEEKDGRSVVVIK